MNLHAIRLGVVASSLCLCGTASAQVFLFSGPDGLAAEAEFTLLDPTTLQVRLKNTSTGLPDYMGDPATVLLSAVSFDLGAAGDNVGDAEIIGGNVAIGSSSFSVNFDTGSYVAGADVSGEFGYSNANGSGLLQNFVTTNTQTMVNQFPGANLDGPVGLNGPQPGLISSNVSYSLGSVGAIQDEVVMTLMLSAAIGDTSFLANGVLVEFGSDDYILPTPSSVALLGLGGLLATRRRR